MKMFKLRREREDLCEKTIQLRCKLKFLAIILYLKRSGDG